MEEDKIDQFNTIAKDVFNSLTTKYGYILTEIKTNEVKGMKWSAHHIYINKTKSLKIEIRQEPYYSDYGFSFFIYKIGTKQYNILYNIPHEKQDKELKFLQKAYADLFSNKETLNIISGEKWTELKYMPFSDWLHCCQP